MQVIFKSGKISAINDSFKLLYSNEVIYSFTCNEMKTNLHDSVLLKYVMLRGVK